jgi:RNA polymerase sigma-70 factor, ECF subfamily
VDRDTDDAALVALARSGDRDAFAELYDRHQAAIFRFALHLTGATHAAEDVVQDVFVAFMRAVGRFELDRSLGAYLLGIARHIAARRLKRERLWMPFDADAHEPATDTPRIAEEIQRRADLLRLRQAIRALPRKHREVIVLCELEQLSYEDVAAMLDCPIGTVRSRLHRARTTLANLLQYSDIDARRVARRGAGWVL